jgi:TFIIF-interacting CTD phosphatase-like protein
MSLDLNKLENKLDEALSNETTETLNKFLNDKRMTNNKQQTAVEWLVEQLSTQFTYGQKIQFERLFEMAKERDKEQKLNMFNCGRQYQVTGEGTFKQVYQEIYGGGEQ